MRADLVAAVPALDFFGFLLTSPLAVGFLRTSALPFHLKEAFHGLEAFLLPLPRGKRLKKLPFHGQRSHKRRCFILCGLDSATRVVNTTPYCEPTSNLHQIMLRRFFASNFLNNLNFSRAYFLLELCTRDLSKSVEKSYYGPNRGQLVSRQY